MAAEIRAECPTHGTLFLRPADISVTVYNRPELSFLTFPCHDCGDIRVQQVTPAVIAKLERISGVRIERIEVAPPTDHPVFDYDDLLAWHEELNRWPTAAATTTPTTAKDQP